MKHIFLLKKIFSLSVLICFSLLVAGAFLLPLTSKEIHSSSIDPDATIELVNTSTTDPTKPCRAKASRTYKETTAQITIDFETEEVASQAEGCDFAKEEVEGELEAECELKNEGSYSYVDQLKLKPCHCESNDDGGLICIQSGEATCYHEREVKWPSKGCSP